MFLMAPSSRRLLAISGDENLVSDYTIFRNVAGDALTISGNYNSIGDFGSYWITDGVAGVSFQTNSGDGIGCGWRNV